MRVESSCKTLVYYITSFLEMVGGGYWRSAVGRGLSEPGFTGFKDGEDEPNAHKAFGGVERQMRNRAFGDGVLFAEECC